MRAVQQIMRRLFLMTLMFSGIALAIYATDIWRPLVCRYEYEFLTTKAAVWAVNKFTDEDEWCEYYDIKSGYRIIYDDYTNGRSTYWNLSGMITHQETHGDDGELIAAPPWRWGMEDQEYPTPPLWAIDREELTDLVELMPRA